ncbi:Multidrug transporter [Pseudomonas sp. OF001]|uniref:multidrug transporter n=1 Tax=unclassified Pseudomonas TaxID=196821 RepID=UPI0010A5A7C7|nr:MULTISPECIES: multidrug transporter [unclassified Pseudomonas]THG78269.1 multidrug transporter [Pseudomonas sp. A-1]WPP44298.1 multidrug transporter [Pseudomonas sp. AN-1]CAD5379097.1 Multidrug transporter [Pseudomonas sp. OF001]
MKLFRSTALGLILTTGLAALPLSASATQDNVSGDPHYTVEAPKAFSMVGDLLIARPLLIAGTVIGAGVFVVTLPFSALGGNVEEAGQALVIEPGREAFVRCLGCTSSWAADEQYAR